MTPVQASEFLDPAKASARFAAWFAEEHARRPRITRLLDEYCELLVDLGIPLDRVSVHTQVLHPELVASGCLWLSDTHASVETGFVHGTNQTERYLVSPLRRVFEAGDSFTCPIDPSESQPAYPILADLAHQGFTEYSVFSMPFSTGLNHALACSTRAPGGFTQDAREAIAASVPFFAARLELGQTHRTARALLETYLGRHTGGEVLKGTIKRGDVQRVAP